MTLAKRSAFLLGMLVMAVGADTVAAQSAAASSDGPVAPMAPRSPIWGTDGLSVYSASALEFSTFSQSDTWHPIAATAARYLTGGGHFVAAVHLPTGASIEKIEIEGCDNSATGALSGVFLSAAGPGGSGSVITTFDSGFAETPGCAFFPVDVSPSVTVEAHSVYLFQLDNSPGDGTTSYNAARVYYRLQVSPAPGSPTFNDVPVSDFGFQYIEALVASGITGGTGGGAFSPNAFVTRRQMAIFLAKALGLYWPD